MNSSVYACFGIFIISAFQSNVILRHPWKTKFRGNLKARYPQATQLLITADGGGSNSSRNHLWKWELQRWADESGLTIQVCHFPPGTSKWNKIEHRLFSAITQNWRGQPLVSYETVIQLIGATHTRTGLTVQARLDQHAYPTGIKISDDQMSHVHLQKAPFHGEWNYTISPGTPDKT
ncbi:MAG: ISAzo13 family transposase [Candidatus Competibacter sp.]